ncbi:efflux RND transporter periplasmic adaptor subunit [Halalkalibaculum sp. DA3122]|uniref:efflux RND transporter periplasmic adaptor subunit n=1 Tax=unclassified Halalkalibaculum TaxID=2964617 RepID=UPI0037549CB7
MNYRYKKLIRSIFALFVIPILVSCGNSGQPGPQQGGAVEGYPVLELEPRSIELTSSYPATLEGRQTVEIRPRVAGYITEMHVDEGDWVNQGELLFSLNSEEYEQEVRSATANVQAAEASVRTAEDEVERLRNLVEKDIVSKYQLQSARNQLTSNQAALAQAEARLTNARVNLEYTRVKSPVDGIIGTIPYRIGSLVSSNISRPLTVVSDISEVYAYFSMSERELLEMAREVSGDEEGRTIQQQVREMPDVNLILADNSTYGHQGTLKLASGLIDKETGSASFRAAFPNPREVLRSGGSASVQIPFLHESAIVIPKRATYEIQNKRFVFAVTDSNTVESTPVSVLPISTPQLFVVDEGLSAGDKIVSSGTGQLSDEAAIQPRPVNADSLYQSLTIRDQQ